MIHRFLVYVLLSGVLFILSGCGDIVRTTTFSVKSTTFDSTILMPDENKWMQATGCRKKCRLKSQVAVERDKQGRLVDSSFALERTINY
jgi:uncharacterized protein YceK